MTSPRETQYPTESAPPIQAPASGNRISPSSPQINIEARENIAAYSVVNNGYMDAAKIIQIIILGSLGREPTQYKEHHALATKALRPPITGLSQDEQLQRLKTIIGIILCLISELIREVGVLGICWLLYLESTIPLDITLLVPGEITLIDVLGRRHPISRSWCPNLRVFESVLKYWWEESDPGYQKVVAGQFRIFDSRNPEKGITANDWDSHARVRWILRMAIDITTLRLMNRCISCGEKLRPFNRMSLICPRPACGQYFLLSNSRVKASELRKMAIAITNFLDVPDIPDTRAEAYFRELVLFQRSSDQPPQPSDSLLNNASEARPEFRIDSASCSFRKGDSPHDEGLEKIEEELGDVEEQIDSETTEDLQISTQGQLTTVQLRSLEESFVPSLTCLYIKQDTRLYDAALEGDVARVLELIGEKADVNCDKGGAGTPLVAGIRSRSVDVVNALLKAGANPLVDGDFAPILMAVYFGNSRILGLLLHSAKRKSLTTPNVFQNAVDHALFQAASMKRFHFLQTLVHVGANPVAAFEVNGAVKTALAVAVRFKNRDFAHFSLIEMWNRQAITDMELKVLSSAVRGDTATVDKAEAGLRACALNLEIGETKQLQYLLQKTLGTTLFFQLPRQYETYNEQISSKNDHVYQDLYDNTDSGIQINVSMWQS